MALQLKKVSVLVVSCGFGKFGQNPGKNSSANIVGSNEDHQYIIDRDLDSHTNSRSSADPHCVQVPAWVVA